ncbi:hypothetical protein ACQCT6_10255 [Cytobacillus gottheilii]
MFWDSAHYGTYITVENGVATLTGTPVPTTHQEALYLKVEKGNARSMVICRVHLPL